MSSSKSSRWWPYIKNLAKLVSVPADVKMPGSGAGIRFLADLQDDLDKNGDETKSGVKSALDDIRANTAEIVRLLAGEQLTVEEQRLRAAGQEVAEALYLWQVAHDYLYADFKGIEQQERVASLKLDEIFVELKAVPERQRDESRHWDEVFAASSLEGALKIEHSWSATKVLFDAGVIGRFIEKRPRVIDLPGGGVRREQDVELESLKDTRAAPQSIDHILSRPGGIVLMGGPGSGKTTLVKRLARSCALGADELKRRYPLLSWCFPVVLPITTFHTERGERDIYHYLQHRMTELGGEILADAFRERWAAGQCLVLLDGLDEVAEVGGRSRAARAVEALLLTAAGNRIVVTTRVVGYNITRLNVPAEHHILEPFSPQETATFIRQWYLAHDRALHPDHPDPVQAAKDAQSLIDDVQKNPGVAGLATNPLMLTIIALIKHANVVLPERRVELYEIALNTLLRSWNRARSLSKKEPVGEEPKLEKTKKLWAAVAYWMHRNVSRTIPETQLHAQLVRVLMEDFRTPQDQADDIASSYLAAARDRSGLLEARGPSTFAFVHQTFQEYLAAIHLAIPGSKAVAKIREHAQDPRWHEAIRLAAGYIVIHQTDFDTLRDVMNALLDDADPLEPYLGTSLRLAAACLSDDIGVQTTESDQVIVKLFACLTGFSFQPLRDAVLTLLPTLRVVPGESAIDVLCHATESENWWTRQEATRMLARVTSGNGEALQVIQRLFHEDNDGGGRAHAAWGLWHSHQRRDRDVVKAIAHSLSNGSLNMKLAPEPTLLSALLDLLKDADGDLRFHATNVLKSWGHQAVAVPTLLDLLKDVDRGVRADAVHVLGNWGHPVEATPTLLDLLKDSDGELRNHAVYALNGWVHQVEAVPTLLGLLKDASGYVRCRAAETLWGWGYQAEALSALLGLLKGADADVRFHALNVLMSWSPQAEVVPTLLDLLKGDDHDRFRAADILRNWGPQAEALPKLQDLLKDAEGQVRAYAASVLVAWGHQVIAIPTLLNLLNDSNENVRFNAMEILSGCGPQAEAFPELLDWLKDADRHDRHLAVNILQSWGLQSDAIPTLVELLKDANTYVRKRAAATLGGWGNSEAVVRAVLPRLFPRTKKDAERIATFLIGAANGGPKQRSVEVSQLLAKALKPNSKDSDERQALRQILFRWTWDALATTA